MRSSINENPFSRERVEALARSVDWAVFPTLRRQRTTWRCDEGHMQVAPIFERMGRGTDTAC